MTSSLPPKAYISNRREIKLANHPKRGVGEKNQVHRSISNFGWRDTWQSGVQRGDQRNYNLLAQEEGVRMGRELVPFFVDGKGKTWGWELGGWLIVRAHFPFSSCSQATIYATPPPPPPHTHRLQELWKGCDSNWVLSHRRRLRSENRFKRTLCNSPQLGRMPTGWRLPEASSPESWSTQEEKSPCNGSGQRGEGSFR